MSQTENIKSYRDYISLKGIRRQMERDRIYKLLKHQKQNEYVAQTVATEREQTKHHI